MNRPIIWDAGPLVSILDRDDAHHNWVVEQSTRLFPPFQTCEAAVAEAFHLLRHVPRAWIKLLEMIGGGTFEISFTLWKQTHDVLALVQRYSNVPMSLADACLVRMSEMIAGSTVFTLDGDFRV